MKCKAGECKYSTHWECAECVELACRKRTNTVRPYKIGFRRDELCSSVLLHLQFVNVIAHSFKTGGGIIH